MFSYIRVPLI